MSTWPFSWAAITALLLAIFLIVTCSPALANSPWSWATYRPARSTDGMAATVTSGCSSPDGAAAKVAPGAVHPARIRIVVAATSGATRKFQVLIFPRASAGRTVAVRARNVGIFLAIRQECVLDPYSSD